MEIKEYDIEKLIPHPRNYRKHPEDQLKHIVKSIEEHGIYRNIIISKDNYILAGHGVIEACKLMGMKKVPCLCVDLNHNSEKAYKILVGDNEISHLGEIDDRALSDMLKDIKDSDLNGLLGTGYDEMMLANLVLVTRPASEIKDINEAREWVGMPDYQEGDDVIKAIISFDSYEERDEIIKLLEIKNARGADKKTCSFWYPDRENSDPSSLIIEEEQEDVTEN